MRFLFILGLIFFLSTPFAAHSEIVSADFIRPLMQWVELRTHVNVPSYPRVVVSHSELVARIGNPMKQAALARALYVPGEVVIDDSFWDPTDVRAVSFLVHELVHHAQQVRGVAYACNNAKEWEAYRLQNLWLAEHGQPPVVNGVWIARMASCN